MYTAFVIGIVFLKYLIELVLVAGNPFSSVVNFSK